MQQNELPDMSRASTSGNVQEWLHYLPSGRNGLGLREERSDPECRRRYVLYPAIKAHSWLSRPTTRVNWALAVR